MLFLFGTVLLRDRRRQLAFFYFLVSVFRWRVKRGSFMLLLFRHRLFLSVLKNRLFDSIVLLAFIVLQHALGVDPAPFFSFFLVHDGLLG